MLRASFNFSKSTAMTSYLFIYLFIYSKQRLINMLYQSGSTQVIAVLIHVDH